ncbi:MAG: hypothetical protein L3J18_03320 [Candidatus Brocadia sp.]|jgi:hypothetical protein|uniref:Lipoprotein n=1 Tax=Candidatus Brocadia fulgida TaxID=380242 RepID=A0A0M2UXW2_9BACT|nr:MAG: hypothetical protein BROFUL_01474 [Candidatus Brocadia fulgida]UJS21350.1 MAG: hypothetical protein L3J18_03320 [Candidatus Brocadia sp.]
MKAILIVLAACLTLSGCATIESAARNQFAFVNYEKTNYQAKPEGCPIDLFFGDKMPTRDYVVIGEINGFIIHEKNITPIIEEKTRQVGGDGVIQIRTTMRMRSGGTVAIPVGNLYVLDEQEQMETAISGKVIKYTDTEQRN